MARRDGRPVWIASDGGQTSTLARVDLQRSGASAEYDEAWLQVLLHRYPDVFPLAQIDSGLGRAVPACRELVLTFGGGRSGALDNLYVTTSGGLVIIEAKLWRNPEARRSVVAQAMEYASAIFRMSVGELQAAVHRARDASGEDPERTLYQLAADAGTDLEEAEFLDSLSRNLQRGRAVIAVVGDGIREDILPLAELLQGHAGERFTFALVELGLYEAPAGNRLVLPSILAQTTLIERGVVKIQDSGPGAAMRVIVEEAASPPAASAHTPRRAISISEDEFYDLLGQRDPSAPALLKAFLERAAALGVRADRQSGLSLKHAAPSGNDLNFGTVSKDGYIDTGPASWFGRTAAGRRYNERLASLIGGMVRDMKGGNENALRTGSEKTPRLTDLLPAHADAWLQAIDDYVREIFAHAEHP